MKYVLLCFGLVFAVFAGDAHATPRPVFTWQDESDATEEVSPSDVAVEEEQDEEKEADDEKADDKKESKVDLKSELQVLGNVFKRRMALIKLKKAQDDDKLKEMFPDIPEDVVNRIRSVTREQTYKLLTYHYVERAKNAEIRILQKLRADNFEGIQDLLEFVEQKKYPSSVAYANLMNILDLNFIYARRKGLIEDEDLVKEIGPKLAAETNRIQGTAGHSDEEVSEAMFKKPGSVPVTWFYKNRKEQTFPFGEVPQVEDFPLVDLNTATAEQLQEIPSLSQEHAEAILKFREKRGSLEGPEELRLVKELPKHLVNAFQSLTMTSHQVKKKKWTFMVFLNGANNLEPFAIGDMNEMEKFGSTNDVNVIVEIARMEHDKKDNGGGEKPNSGYFSNPYQEREKPQFYFGVGNTPGVERYYVLKDDDDMRVQSVVKERVPNVDHGSSEALANFGKWATEQYPADHYALIVWNHGSGWTGISYDDNTHHGMDLPEVREALEAICAQLNEKQGKKKIDIVDFDACLMATYEVAFELCDTVDYLVASQELEPGEGLPYDDVLEWLTMFPEASPVSFCKNLVNCYVRSYGPGGSQTYNGQSSYSETLSAIRMANIPQMRDALEEFAQLLEKRPKLLGETADEIVSEARRFGGRLVDVQDLCYRFSKKAPKDKELQAVYEKIKALIGYPEEDYKLVNEVIVKRRTPGSVIWGYNGWKSPPASMSPFRENYKLARTPLVGPDEKGYYSAKIKFPPVIYPGSRDGEMLKNGQVRADEDDDEDKGPQVVREINYRFNDDSTKRSFKDFENMFITANFPESSILVAEGHLLNQNNSHGITIYFPSYLGYNKEYRRLRFAKDSAWVQLCEKFPLKSLEDAKPIGLLGMSHLNKPTKHELGKIVVREEYQKRMRELKRDQTYQDDLKGLEKDFTSIKEPRRFGEDWHGVMESFVDGVVVVDGLDGSGAPCSRTMMRYLQQGGNALITSSSINRSIWDLPLYRDTLGLKYDQVWDNSFKFQVAGEEAADENEADEKKEGDDSDEGDAKEDSNSNEYEIVKSSEGAKIMTFQVADDADGVEPWLVLPESGKVIGAKIKRNDPKTGKPFRAVVLGFYLNDVTDEKKRRALLKEAMEFLEGGN